MAEADITQYILTALGPKLIDRLFELIAAPANHPEMYWMVTPLVIMTFLMTFYFGKYKKEELGWNTAVGNSMILFFVAIDMLRYMYNIAPQGPMNYFIQPLKTIIVLFIVAEAFFLLFTNMVHFLPKRIAFLISSALPINLQAYIVIAIVYADLPIDRTTLGAGVLLFILLYIIMKLLQLLEDRMMQYIHFEKQVEEKVEEHVVEKSEEVEEKVREKLKKEIQKEKEAAKKKKEEEKKNAEKEKKEIQKEKKPKEKKEK